MNISDILGKAKALLTEREPARAIGYGAAGVIFFVALAFDRIPDMSADEAVATASVAIGTLVGVIEAIRSLVTPTAKLQ